MKYVALVYNHFSIYIKNANNNVNHDNYKHYKTIWEHLSQFADYIVLNVYKNIKLLINLLSKININKLIEFKNKYGYQYIDTLVRYNLINIIDYDLPKYILKNTKQISIAKLLYEKYKDNECLTKFINIIKPNINKLTVCNADKLFNMFVITQNFEGFCEWGDGNHKNKKENIENHFEKHVKNGNENWKIIFETVKQYENFAMNTSKIMTNKTIHTNGSKVYLSGLYGKIFIIGRLDSKYNLGISSCYVICDEKYENKINNIKKNMCFELDN